MPVRPISRTAVTAPMPSISRSRALLVEDDGHPLLDVGQACVGGAELTHEVLGEFLAGAFRRRFGSDRAQQRRSRLGSERLRSATRDEVAQQRVELVGDPNPLRSKVRTTFLEQREHGGVILGGHDGGVAVQRCDARGRGGIDHVGLAAAATRQLPNSCGRCRGDVEHDLAASDEPLREMASKPTSVLDGPTPLRELLRPSHQLAIARQRCVDTQRS